MIYFTMVLKRNSEQMEKTLFLGDPDSKTLLPWAFLSMTIKQIEQ